MTNTEAFALARRKARYGHRDWLVWKGRDGAWNAAVRSPASIKRAMLAAGTKGRWHLISDGGPSQIGFWAMGLIMLRNAKVGC
jgi:hypothetical protein